MSFNDLLRSAADAGLLDDALRWRDRRKLRNSTGHADDEALARAVAAQIPSFAADAAALLRVRFPTSTCCSCRRLD